MHRRLNLTYVLVTIAAGLIALFAWLTGVPSLPALFKTSRPEQPSSSPPTLQLAPAATPIQALPLPARDQRQLSTKEVPTDPITFVAFLNGVLDKTLTDIQRDEFINSHEGRRVTWEGYVISVKSEPIGVDSSHSFSLAVRPELEGKEWGPLHFNFAMAWFSPEAKQDLLTLHADQRVIISGILKVKTDPKFPMLDDARLEKIYP